MTKYFAHSHPRKPLEDWQPLDQHLKNVGELARAFAEVFEAGDWGDWTGLSHDIGKCQKGFQQRLKGENIRVNHTGPGAKYVVTASDAAGKLIAYAVAGHHGGMPDGHDSNRRGLNDIVQDALELDPECSGLIPTDLETPKLPLDFKKKRVGFQLSFFIRMIFSCLVDSDFLDTEDFLAPEKGIHRKNRPSLNSLEGRLNKRLSQFTPDTPINAKRADILKSCRQAATHAPGLFSLNVPTGGGKTLSSLAFALEHARRHGFRRVIYVIPYTSIIEQNAAVFRDVLGDDAVIEHHSNFTWKEEDNEESSPAEQRHRLACENWDAPVVVTTNVQFFESFYSNRPSKCRKLHNIAGSIIILDEAQMLPVEHLQPCLEVIRELSCNYHCSVVLCTATQPALQKRQDFSIGLGQPSEIISNPKPLHEAFRRVRTHRNIELDDDAVAERLLAENQVLSIVNTRRGAADLFRKIGDEENSFHLSARMCPKHRRQVLDKVRNLLDSGASCRLVSTQLIEAGVDIDFPIVYREIAGLDSLAQAAGRCNREGRRKELGRLFVYESANGTTPKIFRKAIHITKSILQSYDDPFSPEAIEQYFREVYWLAEKTDICQIIAQLNAGDRSADFPFRTVANQFRFIKNDMLPVIIPFDDKATSLIRSIPFVENPGAVLRKLQSYTVQIYQREYSELQRLHALDSNMEYYSALSTISPYYDQKVGIDLDAALPPEDFIF